MRFFGVKNPRWRELFAEAFFVNPTRVTRSVKLLQKCFVVTKRYRATKFVVEKLISMYCTFPLDRAK